ncbi:MAG TPA: DivIVA domain-containing protein [Jatrophihabitantaceae bacterium]|jgi:DivIVA domain-containing protein|nr:DivIVA domain-containing protein [Jatrophihabitantaceae bacterium]
MSHHEGDEMSAQTYGDQESVGADPLDLGQVSFSETTAFGARGYDEQEVDAFVAMVTHELDRLSGRVKELEAEGAELREAARSDADVVAQSLDILASAQQAADAVVASADEYSGRVIAEARQAYDDASQRAQEIMDEAQQAADLASATQSELDKRTVYLAALHDSVKVQLTTTLQAILDHVTSEYEKATRITDEVARARQASSG